MPIPLDAAGRILGEHELRHAGAPLWRAPVAVVLVHGRGATAESMLPLADVLALPDLAYLAPEAPGNTWYPLTFLAPLARNEPYLSNSLARIGRIVEDLMRSGLTQERIALLGFSQGACLSLEFAARHGGRFGAVVAFAGGLIGPDMRGRDDRHSLDGTPVFIGCAEADAHIPAERVVESAAHLEALGAVVAYRLYPGSAHAVNDDEIANARRLLAPLRTPGPGAGGNQANGGGVS